MSACMSLFQILCVLYDLCSAVPLGQLWSLWLDLAAAGWAMHISCRYCRQRLLPESRRYDSLGVDLIPATIGITRCQTDSRCKSAHPRVILKVLLLTPLHAATTATWTFFHGTSTSPSIAPVRQNIMSGQLCHPTCLRHHKTSLDLAQAHSQHALHSCDA